MKTTHQQKLEAELARITAELNELGIHNPENPSDWIATPKTMIDEEADENVSADRVEEWDAHQGVLAELETEYNNVQRALKKLREETYGSCEVCGKPIEEKRLVANPAARTCVAHREEERALLS